MSRQRKFRKSQKATQCTGQGCGCRFDPSEGFHFHHTTPTTPDEANDLPEEMMSDFPPEAGPALLLDMAAWLRRQGGDSTRDADPWYLQAGDMVKLCFLVRDHKYPWLPQELRRAMPHCDSEAMWVRVLRREGDGDKATYHGELCSVPLLIDPNQLQIRARLLSTAPRVESRPYFLRTHLDPIHPCSRPHHTGVM
jgi:hypothetical protein